MEGINTAIIEEPSVAADVAEHANWQKDLVLPDGVELSDKDREFSTIGDYIKATHSLRGMIDSKGMILPEEGAEADVISKFHQDLPEHLRVAPAVTAPEEYVVESINGDEALTDDRRADIYGQFRELGLTNAQAEGVVAMNQAEGKLHVDWMRSQTAATALETEKAFRAKLGAKYDDTMKGVDLMREKHSAFVEKLATYGLEASPEFFDVMIELHDATAEDTTSSNDVGGDIESFDRQIKDIKANPLYRGGSTFERAPLIDQITELERKKSQARK